MEKLIILIVLVTGVIALAQLVRVYELTSKLKKRGEHEITDRDNHLNAKMMLVFMAFQFLGFIYLMLEYGWTGRGEAASFQGQETDWLLNLNFVIVILVFFITNFLLFFFSFKYVRKPGVKAYYYSHNNKLEALWTVVPAVVLAVIIVLGLRTWGELTSGPSKRRNGLSCSLNNSIGQCVILEKIISWENMIISSQTKVIILWRLLPLKPLNPH
jgi:cytochrome c oxidase subunit 2